MTGVLIREKREEFETQRQGRDDVKVKVEIGIMSRQVKNAWSPLKLAKDSKASPQSLWIEHNPANSSTLYSCLQNSERINFCYFKLPSLQWFVTAALGNEGNMITEIIFGMRHEGQIVFGHAEAIMWQEAWHSLKREYLNKALELGILEGKRKWVFCYLRMVSEWCGEVEEKRRQQVRSGCRRRERERIMRRKKKVENQQWKPLEKEMECGEKYYPSGWGAWDLEKTRCLLTVVQIFEGEYFWKKTVTILHA